MLPDPRPELSPALDALVADLARAVPAVRHVKATAVLVVAGGALENSRASIRGLADWKVITAGHRRLYEVTLRPLFFLDANGMGRLVTLLHELFHVARACDGALDPDRRHGSGADFDTEVEQAARAYAARADAALLAPLAHHGEVLVRQWRVRPGPGAARRVFGPGALFTGPVRMQTPRGERSGAF